MFWAGLGKVQSGNEPGGLELVRAAIALAPGWAELLPRLGPDVSPVAARVAERLRADRTG
jgi:hypothetical protein